MQRLTVSLSCLMLIVSALSAELTNYASIDEAIARGDLADVKLHIQHFPERLDQAQRSKSPPLHLSILRKQTEIAEYLITAGADVNAIDSSDRTPLHLCVERNLPELVEVLIEAKADPNTLDKVGWTPLHHAAAKNRLEVAVALVEGGADVQTLSKLGGTALHEAAVGADNEFIRYLLAQGLSLDAKAKDGTTPLSLAEKHKNEAALEVFQSTDTPKEK